MIEPLHIEPLDIVYLARWARSSSKYHRPGHARQWHRGLYTRCGIQKTADCEPVPEIEAVLHFEPCARCFTVRGRRQRILNQITVAGLPDG